MPLEFARAQSGSLRLVTRFGKLSGSITVTMRIPEYCGSFMMFTIASI